MKDLGDEMVARIAERFGGLADATRIRILVRLQGGECNVSTLANELEVAQASISKHLAVLKGLGFILVRVSASRRRGHMDDGRADRANQRRQGGRRHEVAGQKGAPRPLTPQLLGLGGGPLPDIQVPRPGAQPLLKRTRERWRARVPSRGHPPQQDERDRQKAEPGHPHA